MALYTAVMSLNKESEAEGEKKVEVERRKRRQRDGYTKRKSEEKGRRSRRQRGETCGAQHQLCVGRGGGGGGPVNQPASCQHLPPAPPQGLLKPLS